MGNVLEADSQALPPRDCDRGSGCGLGICIVMGSFGGSSRGLQTSERQTVMYRLFLPPTVYQPSRGSPHPTSPWTPGLTFHTPFPVPFKRNLLALPAQRKLSELRN